MMMNETETFGLLKDYCLFRLNNSPVAEAKKINFPSSTPSDVSQKMRFLAHKWAGELKSWPQLTNGKDFSIFSYNEFQLSMQQGFENLKDVTSMVIYAYFEFVSVCAIFSISTNINGPNLNDICQYAAHYLHSSEKFLSFLFHHHGWASFLTKEYQKAKLEQSSLFNHWLAVLNEGFLV